MHKLNFLLVEFVFISCASIFSLFYRLVLQNSDGAAAAMHSPNEACLLHVFLSNLALKSNITENEMQHGLNHYN